MNVYDEARVRHGKTRKDRESGAHRQRLANRDAMGNWHRLSNGEKERTAFPSYLCNGRKTQALRRRATKN